MALTASGVSRLDQEGRVFLLDSEEASCFEEEDCFGPSIVVLQKLQRVFVGSVRDVQLDRVHVLGKAAREHDNGQAALLDYEHAARPVGRDRFPLGSRFPVSDFVAQNVAEPPRVLISKAVVADRRGRDHEVLVAYGEKLRFGTQAQGGSLVQMKPRRALVTLEPAAGIDHATHSLSNIHSQTNDCQGAKANARGHLAPAEDGHRGARGARDCRVRSGIAPAVPHYSRLELKVALRLGGVGAFGIA